MSSTTCPTFSPTLAEFDDFSKFISSIESNNPNLCICKIIPPPEWHSHPIDLSADALDKLKIASPIRQLFGGARGVYSLVLEELRSMTYNKFKAKAEANQDGIEKLSAEARENAFWKSQLGPWEPPIYGADIPGSLFHPMERSSWNLSKLKSLLSLKELNVPGVSSSMLYIGMWRAMFAYHTEDMFLYSINYLHAGAQKSWYSIPQHAVARFETMMISHFPEEHLRCKEFLRHKTSIVSPSKLREAGIPFQTVLQSAGEFVITFPRGYHAGFNHGLNIAEATNFATPLWLPIGKTAKVCNCRPSSCRIPVYSLELLYRKQLKAQGLPMPRYVRCECSSIKETGPLLWCRECGLGCHQMCIQGHYDIDSFLCYMCAEDQSFSSTIEYEDPLTPVDPLSQVEVPAIVRKGSCVSYYTEGFRYIGTIIDIVDGHALLHTKGTRKDEDFWFSLIDSVYHIEDKGVEPSEAKRSKSMHLTPSRRAQGKQGEEGVRPKKARRVRSKVSNEQQEVGVQESDSSLGSTELVTTSLEVQSSIVEVMSSMEEMGSTMELVPTSMVETSSMEEMEEMEEEDEVVSLKDPMMEQRESSEDLMGKRLSSRVNESTMERVWTAEEDAEVVDLYEQYGRNWIRISDYFIGRSSKDVRLRCTSILGIND